MEKQQHTPARASRRRFLKTAGLATAGAFAADWARSSRFALASPRAIGANERLRVAVVGCGGQGMVHLRNLMALREEQNLDVVGVCDIYEPRKARAGRTAEGAAVYHEHEKLLEEAKPDVVFIASPEPWHARQAIDSMEAGCDIYLEKPMTRYLDEATEVYQAARRTGRLVQIGSQLSSNPKWERAGALIREGKIGKPVWSQASVCRNSKGGEWNYRIEPGASPETVDWDRWQAPVANKVPFSADRYFRWRKYWDYSSGIVHDLFPHRLHPLYAALGAAEFPARVVCTGGIYVHHDRDVPDITHMLLDFPSGHTIFVAGSTANENGPDYLIRGHKANMLLGGDAIVIRPERPWAEEVDEHTERVQGPQDEVRAHEENLLRAVRSREQPSCNVEIGYRVHVAVCLAEISYRENRVVGFDPEKLEITDGRIPDAPPIGG